MPSQALGLLMEHWISCSTESATIHGLPSFDFFADQVLTRVSALILALYAQRLIGSQTWRDGVCLIIDFESLLNYDPWIFPEDIYIYKSKWSSAGTVAAHITPTLGT